MRPFRPGVAAGMLVAGSWFVLAPQGGPEAALVAGQTIESAAAGRVTVAEFKKLFEAGSVIVLDVRARDAYEQGHIPGAISVPFETVEKRAAEWRSASKPIVTYCT